MAIDYATGTGDYMSDWHNDGYAYGQKTYFLQNILASAEGQKRFAEILQAITSGAPYAMWDCAKLLCDKLGIPDFVPNGEDKEADHAVCGMMETMILRQEARSRMASVFQNGVDLHDLDRLYEQVSAEYAILYPPIPKYTAAERAAMADDDPRKHQLSFRIFESVGRMIINPAIKDKFLGMIAINEA